MWSDGGQRRTLLRFRQANANSNDTQVRIDDSSEAREPKYCVRQLMADFLPKRVREAWQIPVGGTALGFEFISDATFRDVNFGELTRPSVQFKVTGRDAERLGFKLCRHCGKVQKHARSGDHAAEQTNSFECPKYGGNKAVSLGLPNVIDATAYRATPPVRCVFDQHAGGGGQLGKPFRCGRCLIPERPNQ